MDDRGNNESKTPKLRLVKGLRGRIEDIEREMAELEQQRVLLATTDGILAQIEEELRAMQTLAQSASTEDDDQARAALNVEFELRKRRIALLAQSADVDGENLLLGGLDGVRSTIGALDRLLRERYQN